MSGLSVLCNAGPLIRVSDRHLQIKGRTLRHLGEAESQILFLRGDLLFYLREAIRGMPKEDAISMVIPVLRKIRFRWIGCKSEDIHRFYSTLEGRVFSFWQSVRDNGLSYDECRELYFDEAQRNEDWEREIKHHIESASGESEVRGLYKIYGTYRLEIDANDEYLISRTGLFSSLFKQPFGFTPDQVSEMTLGQIGLILSGDKSPDDTEDESVIAKRHYNTATRRMLQGYDKCYREMAENIISGRPLMSGLRTVN